MLQLKSVKKTYVTGELTQDALKGISITFRENEFVSVLGASGSGKTTLLNVIGGLDRYDSGELLINGISTREYGDGEWDAYRNDRVGFVFQNYNLIPHQSVLSNVELALTLAGVSRKERYRRAKTALEKVGLGQHIHKKPNQLSGGQMQRVAIARALVNDPDILLADEPTGALDSETSLQVMALLKEVARSRLVIMVTHNPELAKDYSTRIIKLKDGQIIGDTNPCTGEEAMAAPACRKKVGMTLWTALSLSFHNLRTKKGRTILTSFAGSIGIIGIALILALSTGMNAYIARIQRETMTSYPVIIGRETFDASVITGLQGALVGGAHEETHPHRTAVYGDYSHVEISNELSSGAVENDLSGFKAYLDDPGSEIHNYLGENGIHYTYDVKFDIFTKDATGKLINTEEKVGEAYSLPMDGGASFGPEMFREMMGGSGNGLFSQLMSGIRGEGVSDTLRSSYQLLHGAWPEKANEVVLVLGRDNTLPVTTLCQLGLITEEQYLQGVEAVKRGETPPELILDYKAIRGHEFYLIPACDQYVKQADGTFTPLEAKAVNGEALLENAIYLTISGILRPLPDGDHAVISTAVGYTEALTRRIIDYTSTSPVVTAQQENPDVNVCTGLNFSPSTDEEKAEDTKAFLMKMPISQKARLYGLLEYYGGIRGGATDENELAASLDMWLENDPPQTVLLTLYDQYIGESSNEENLESFGYVTYDDPAAISIYTDRFEDKEAIARCIEHYNASAPEEQRITYTDYVALLTSSLTTIINGVSYVLVAFVAISLVVSCIMIGIITHISVMERTKEIGILRSIGAAKRDISRVFNAETFIIGCGAGLIGIGVSLLGLIPVNAVISRMPVLEGLRAELSFPAAAMLVAISIGITILGGLLPAQKAAKKDPVLALRSE